MRCARMLCLCLIAALFSAAGPAMAAPAGQTYRLCLFDVAGRQGEIYAIMKSYQLAALREGIALTMDAFRDEAEAIAAYEAGECDIAGLSDLGIRRYNRFTGSLSAIGTVPSYPDLKLLLKFLSHPRLARLEKENGHEILGVLPLGAVYLYVRDASIRTVEALKGKRVAVLAEHADAEAMIRQVGAVPVPARISNFAEMFKRGEVDIVYAPGGAYEVLEMYKGLEPKGGIIRFALGQFTLQLVAREGVFPAEFVRASRRIMGDMSDDALRKVLAYEAAIPERWWIDLPERTQTAYLEMIRRLRMNLEASGVPRAAQVYHPTMLRLLRKIRCHNNPMAAECSAANRE